MKSLVLVAALLYPVAARAQDAAAPAPSADERIKALEDRISALETKPANASLSSFNPAIGMAIDTVLRDYDDRATFDFRSAELNIEAAADPFVKVYSVITGSSGGVDVEETAAQTTSLPYNLTVRGGRFFAPFGHFANWHDHELPMVYRPNSLLTYVGGETRADGADVNYLFPTPFYLEAYAGVFNKIGADNNRVDDGAGRPFDQFTYLAHLHTYADLTDSTGVDLGLSEAWTPKVRYAPAATGAGQPLNRSERTLSGVDLTVRYQPSVGGLYHGVVWTTEAMQNGEQRYDAATGLPLGRGRSYAGFSNVETKLGRVTRLGGFADLTELPNDSRRVVKTFAGYLTFELTEFNRIRLQYSRTLANFNDAVESLPGTGFAAGDLFGLRRGHMVAVQWTCIIGYHVHGFRGRWGT